MADEQTDSSENASPKPDADSLLEELRQLILGDLPVQQVDVWRELAERPEAFAYHVGQALPQALKNCADDREKQMWALMAVLRPLVEESLQESSRRDIRPLSEALYPVMAPAIRKSVRESFRQLNQQVDHSLNQALSPRHLGYRLKAWQQGRSYLEVLSEKEPFFRVRNVYLIHHQSSLLLEYVHAPGATGEDPDMVSAMLRAVEDFVRDSFQVEGSERLSQIEIGSYTLLMEAGPQAVLAVVVEGFPPQSWREALSQTLEDIHQRFDQELRRFDGDTHVFAPLRPLLEALLDSQAAYKNVSGGPPKPNPWPKRVLLALLVLLLGGLWWLGLRSDRRWEAYLERLRTDDRYLVMRQGQRDGRFFVVGRRAAASPPPEAYLSEVGLRPSEVTSRWQWFQPLDSALLMRRAKGLLEPPHNVHMALDSGNVLTLSGQADSLWLARARERMASVWEIARIDASGLELRSAFRALRRKVGELYFTYPPGEYEVGEGQSAKIDSVAHWLNRWRAEAPESRWQLHVFGYADSLGSEQTNRRISRLRAQRLSELLRLRGVPADRIVLHPIGYRSDSSEGEAIDKKRVEIALKPSGN